MNKNNYWSPIQVTITLDDDIILKFTFEFSCDSAYRRNSFDWSLVILIILGIGFVTLLARFGKIYSFSYMMLEKSSFEGINDNPLFQGFTVNIKILVIYLILYLIIALLCIYLYQGMKYVAEFSSYLLGFICCFFMINEVLNLFKSLNIRFFVYPKEGHG